MHSAPRGKLRDLAKEFPELQEALDAAYPEETNSDWEEMLARASLSRRFDRGLYESLLVGGLEHPPSFEDFIGRSEVERVPYTEGQFWIADRVRRTHLDAWSQRDDRQAWSEKLVAHFEAQTEVSAFELLEQTIRANPSKARELFEQLFDEADAKGELSRCFALLQVLEATRRDHDKLLSDTWRAYDALYQSRALFADELHRTAKYFPRVGPQRAFERVLTGEMGKKWIFHLHGGGGIGKTTLLRWLVARRLVPRPARVACVRIDFDTVSVSAVAEMPWLLGIPIADQLDPQLETPPFESFRYSATPFRRLLTPGHQADADADDTLRDSAAGQDFWRQLLRNSEALPPDKLIVIFLDTLEEASVHRPGDLLAIIDQVATLREKLPQIRLVLSGRYALGLEHAREYLNRYRRVTCYRRLRRLSRQEARAFVTMQAELPAPLADAIVARGDGNPFKLSLLIELVADDSTITAERVRSSEFDNVDETYLIERVVRRIPAADQLPLRWVVRYGVVPRRLTRDFIAEVLVPALTRALAGEAHNAGDDWIEEHLQNRAWSFAPGSSLDPDALWQQLTAYSTSGGHGWLQVSRDAGIAHLHTDVVNPMRRLLGRQRVFTELHRRALDYFAGRCLTADVLFHELQLDPDKFMEHVAHAFADPELRQDPLAWRRLTEELVTRDFASAPAAVQAFAHVQAAEAISAASNYTLILDSRRFDDLSAHLNAARALEQDAGVVVTPLWLDVGAQAIRLLRSGDAAAARAHLEDAVDSADDTSRVHLRLVLGDLRARADALDTESTYTQALQDASTQPSSIRAIIQERLGNWAARRADWPAAEAAYHAALELLQLHVAGTRTFRLRGRLVELALWTGRWRRALDLLAESTGDNDQWLRLRASAALKLGRPLAADRLCVTLLDRPAGTGHSEALFLRAGAAEQQLALSTAMADYRAARHEFAAAGDLSGRDRCRAAEFHMYLRAGNLREARLCAQQGPLETGDRNPALRVQWELLNAHVATCNGDLDRASAVVRDLAREDAAGQTPPQLVLVLSAGLAFGVWTPRKAAARLINALQQVKPPAARIPLLEYLTVGQAWKGISGSMARQLEALIPFEPDGDIEAPAWALARADMLRLIGRGADAAAIVARAVPPPTAANPEAAIPFLARLQLERRLRQDGVMLPPPAEPIESWKAVLGSLPYVHAAILIEAADIAIPYGDWALAKRLATDAAAILAREALPTEYHARCRSIEALLGLRTEKEADAAFAQIGLERVAAAPDPPAVAPQKAASAPPPEGRAIPPPGVAAAAGGAQRFGSPPGSGLDIVSIRGDDGQFLVQRALDHATSGSPLLVDLAHELERRGTSSLPERIAGNWVAFASELWRVVAAVEAPANSSEGRLALNLPPQLAALPWELMHAVRPGERRPAGTTPIRCLGERVVSRPPVNLGTGAGEIAGAASGINAPRVLLIDGTRFTRSVSGYAYERLARAFMAGGVEFHDYERVGDFEQSPRQMQETLMRVAPAVIYIVSPMLDATRSPDPVLHVGRIEPKLLGYALEASQVTPRPLVILDTPRAGAPAEDVAQLLARNRFAFELFRRGGVPAVLATGLGDDQEIERIHQCIIAAISISRPQDETLDAIAALWNGPPDVHALSRTLPFLGTALFSNQPAASIAPRLVP